MNTHTSHTKAIRAQLLAEELGCPALPLGDAPADLSGYAAVAFGSRLHAGTLDGWKKARKLLNSRGAKKLVVFATGAMPNEAEEAIEKMWTQNLTPAERELVRLLLQGSRSEKSGNRTSPPGSWTPSPSSTSRRGCAWRSWARVTGPC